MSPARSPRASSAATASVSAGAVVSALVQLGIGGTEPQPHAEERQRHADEEQQARIGAGVRQPADPSRRPWSGGSSPPPSSSTGGCVDTPELLGGTVCVCAGATAGEHSAIAASRTAARRRICTSRDSSASFGRCPGDGRCGSVGAMLTAAQSERLEACARVLDAPARIVMTGAVSPSARAAVMAGAGAGRRAARRRRGRGPARRRLDRRPVHRPDVALQRRRWTSSSAGPRASCPGGTLFVYGAFASPALTTAMLRTIGTSRAWRYFGRDGALAEFVHAELSARRARARRASPRPRSCRTSPARRRAAAPRG